MLHFRSICNLINECKSKNGAASKIWHKQWYLKHATELTHCWPGNLSLVAIFRGGNAPWILHEPRVFALIGLILKHKKKVVPRFVVSIAPPLSHCSVAFLEWKNNLGDEIRHSEIQKNKGQDLPKNLDLEDRPTQFLLGSQLAAYRTRRFYVFLFR